jgi:hypothetical protein
MAQLGPEPQLASDVATLLNRTSQQVGPTRSQLIDKGLLYTSNHGYAAPSLCRFSISSCFEQFLISVSRSCVTAGAGTQPELVRPWPNPIIAEVCLAASGGHPGGSFVPSALKIRRVFSQTPQVKPHGSQEL